MQTAIWSSAIYMVSKGENPCKRSSHTPYSVLDVRKIIKRRREEEMKKGKPRRKSSPVTPWLLDELLDIYIAKDSKGYNLEIITVQDKRECLVT
jgi:hypothetical protein